MAMFINQPLILAPMAGITDSPFRQLAKKFGADLVVTEMISARGLIQDDRKTKAMLSFQPLEQPLIVQLFGREPEILRAAALKALDAGAACIDINMGCPVKKVIKTGAGAALLKDLKQIKKILQALSQSPEIPYTIKIRAGWDHTSLNAGTVFQLAADHGAKAVFCHPRTATMMFGGAADWDYLEETARRISKNSSGTGKLHPSTGQKSLLPSYSIGSSWNITRANTPDFYYFASIWPGIAAVCREPRPSDNRFFPLPAGKNLPA